ncbi:MAG: ABC transporter ATP-binding protein, partial [Planctomycetota bacterium]|nr:ABC transporter ATP-binding protein [Planctomycetota bacterium]
MGSGLSQNDRYDRGKPRKGMLALGAAVRRLLRQVELPARGLALLGAMTLFGAVVPLAAPRVLGLVVDALTGKPAWPVFIGDAADRVLFLIGIFLALQALSFAFSYSRDMLARRISQESLFSLRTRMFDALQRRTLLSLEREQTGALMSRVMEEPAVLESLFWGALASLVSAPITFAGIAVVLFVMDRELLAYALLPLPLMIVAGVFFISRMRGITALLHERTAALFAFLQERLAGSAIVRAFGMRERETARFRRLSDSAMELKLRMDKLLAQYLPLLAFATTLGIVFVLLAGTGRVMRGEISAGLLVSFIAYLAFFYGPLTEMSRAHFLLQNAAICSERIAEILEPRTEEQENRKGVRLESCRGEVELRNVSFRYDALSGEGISQPSASAKDTPSCHVPTAVGASPLPVDKEILSASGGSAKGGNRVQNDKSKSLEQNHASRGLVLKDMSLVIAPGEKVAIVGKTGAGKSTLSKLLLGLYEPTAGAVLLDGVPLCGIDAGSLAGCVSIVLQDDVVFNESLRANIVYGCAEDSPELDRRVGEAVKTACFDEVCRSLPDGLNTHAGENGERLSRGERQRLSIAR